MKIKSYKISAVIPVGNYANIQPAIEIEDATIEEANGLAMGHIKDMFARHSDVPIKDSDIVKSISKTIKLKSFTEGGVEVDYDDIKHAYSHKGTPLVGATAFISKFTGKFDAPMVAKNCEKSWGVGANEILDMWESNKNVAMDFGTLVHKALEHYHNNKALGAKIMESRGTDENPALPKHPILRDIILGFDAITAEDAGVVISEILATDVKNGRCGQIDRLVVVDADKKICRVQDYKINVSSEEVSSKNKLLKPYDTLPATKLSKYQLQLNFYAQMLEASGWTVQGIDVFVYEDEWKKFELTRVII